MVRRIIGHMKTGTFNLLEATMKAESFQLLQRYIERVKQGTVPVLEWEYFNGEELEKAILLNKSNYNEHIKEYHKAFTDIHITISGEDIIYLGEAITTVAEPYQENGDYCLVESPTTSTAQIPPGHFAILKPTEIHSNLLSGENALKVVIKFK